MPGKPPNIILTIADDQRGTAIGCAGRELVQTTAMDALAARGVRFAQAQHLGSCHGAICAPSRAMLMTGIPYFKLDPALLDEHGLPKDREVFIPPTLGRKLRGAGYHTFATGKWHNGAHTLHPSFDSGANLFFGGMADHWFTPVYDFDPSGKYPRETLRTADGFSTEVFANSAIDFIRSRKGNDQPFFCYCAFTAPHDPRTPPDKWRRKYKPTDIPLPPNVVPGQPFDRKFWDRSDEAAREEILIAHAHTRVWGRDERLLGTPRDLNEIKRSMAEYYGMISHMDEWIGRIHQAAEEIGELENTIIIHTGDHGLAVGQHGLLGKQNLYQHSLNVPLIMAGPGIPRGLVSDALCYQHDLHPALLELARIGNTQPAPFQSLLPLMKNESGGRAHIASAFETTQRAIRDSRYKLIEYTLNGEKCSQLFDLENDPWETRDLSGDAQHKAVIETLRNELRRWQEQVGDSGAPALP